MLIVIMLCVIVLSVIMLSVIMLRVVMLIVVAPPEGNPHFQCCLKLKKQKISKFASSN